MVFVVRVSHAASSRAISRAARRSFDKETTCVSRRVTFDANSARSDSDAASRAETSSRDASSFSFSFFFADGMLNGIAIKLARLYIQQQKQQHHQQIHGSMIMIPCLLLRSIFFYYEMKGNLILGMEFIL